MERKNTPDVRTLAGVSEKPIRGLPEEQRSRRRCEEAARPRFRGGGGLVPGVTAADGSVRPKHAPTCQCSIRGVALTYSQLQQEKQPLSSSGNDCWSSVWDARGYCFHTLIKRSSWKLDLPAVLSIFRENRFFCEAVLLFNQTGFFSSSYFTLWSHFLIRHSLQRVNNC